MKRNVVTLYLVGYLVLIGFTGWGFLLARQQRNELRDEVVERQTFDQKRDYDICVSGNKVREALVEAILSGGDNMVDALGAAAGKNAITPREKEKLAGQLKEFKADLRVRQEKTLEIVKPRECATPPLTSPPTAGP